VPGAAGTWKDLDRQLNLLGRNLTRRCLPSPTGRDRRHKGNLTRFRSCRCARRSRRAQRQSSMTPYLPEAVNTDRNTDRLKTTWQFTTCWQGQRDLTTMGGCF